MIYNSMDKMYKSVFGAAKTGEEVCYRIYAPQSAQAFFVVRYREDGQYEYCEMNRDEYGWYTMKRSYDKIGVYFYHFAIKYANGYQNHIHRHASGCDTYEGNADWQQTVYTEDYTTPDWIKHGLIYQIFPDRFYKAPIEYEKVYEDRVNADWNDEPIFANGSKGAVINNDYFGGNLEGIIQKLPYLKSLGVTAVYLNPIFEAHSNHRYNTANYMKVDPLLGTNADFKRLCEKAHESGIKIILDGVFSHTGSDSIYFNREGRYNGPGAYQSQQSPYYSWFKFQRFPEEYTSWWGFETLPETVETDAEFSRYITGENGVIDYWMKLGADGFRLDVADELPDSFIRKIRTAVKRANKNGILYGEVWEDASNKISYGEQRQFLNGEELDSVMNYPFSGLIFGFVKGFSGTAFIYSVMQILENYPKCSSDSLMNLLGTHDTERLITNLAGEPAFDRGRDWQAYQQMTDIQLDYGRKLLYLATALQYTLPGVPCLYYGDEILTQGYRDPFNRKSFKWEKVTDDNEILNWYKKLGELRNCCPALEGGEFIPVQYDEKYVSFIRAKDGDELFTIINPSDNTIGVWVLPGWKEDTVIFGNPPTDEGLIYVQPKSVAMMGRGDWVKELSFIKKDVKSCE